VVKLLYFDPVFFDKIWGGSKINQLNCWNDTVSDHCGEVWLLSDVPGSETKIISSDIESFTLGKLIKEDSNNTYFSKKFTEKYPNQFPLLLKLIDAQDDLSIQVHPNDEIASRKHQTLGKSESWLILEKEDNAFIYLGWNTSMTPEMVEKASIEGNIDHFMNHHTVQDHEMYYIPAGLVHSIGRGVLLAEIQQSSDITYRLFDFNRKDNHGHLRDLHLQESIDALNYNQFFPEKELKTDCIDSPYFKYRQFLNQSKKTVSFDQGGFIIWVMNGKITTWIEGNSEIILKQQVVWVPYSWKNFNIEVESNSHWLIIDIP
jgi:mannose-6-phosphate isomerase